MTRFLFDTAVFAHALGAEHELRGPCQAIIRSTASGELRGEASADLGHELAQVRLRRTGDRAAAARAARYALALCVVHEVTADDAARALDLFEAQPRLDARDAVFAAVAERRGIGVILSPDRAFDDLSGLRRVDPLDAVAVGELIVR